MSHRIEKRSPLFALQEDPDIPLDEVAIDSRSRSFLTERIFVLLQGEPRVQLPEDRTWLYQPRCTLYQSRSTKVAASREVQLGKDDLPKSPTAPHPVAASPEASQEVIVHLQSPYGIHAPRALACSPSGNPKLKETG